MEDILQGLLAPRMADPTIMGLLSAAAAGMQASGPSRTPTSLGQTFGAALGAGVPAYQQTQNLNAQRGMQSLQTAKMLDDMAQMAQKRGAIRAYAAGLPEADQARFLADPEAFLKEEGKGQVVAPGSSLVRGGKSVYTAPEKVEYGTTPHYEKGPDGKTYAVYSDKQGNRKMVEATPMNQFTTPSVDAQNRLGWDQYKFGNVDATDRIRLGADLGRLANQGIETSFNTGQGVGRPMMGGIPQNAPMPAFGQPGFAPTQSPAQMAPQPTQQMQQVPRPMAPSAPMQGGPLLPPSMNGAITPKKQMELAAARPEAEAALNSTRMNFQNAISSARDVLKAPGLDRITGPIMGRLPNLTGDATNAQASLDTLKSQIGVHVLQAMREASKTGGAVGNVTEKEWPILQNQLGALQQAQTFGQFKMNLNAVVNTLQRMEKNSVSAWEKIYGKAPDMPAASTATPEKNSMGGGIDALINQYAPK